MAESVEMITFTQIVHEALGKCQDGPDANERAWRWMRKRIEALPAAEREEVIWEGLRRGAMDSMSDIRSGARNTAKMVAANPCMRDLSAVDSVSDTLRRAVNKSVMDVWTEGGRKLGDLTGRDLALLRARARGQKDGWTAKENLWDALSKLVPDDKRVRDCVTDEQVHEIARRQRAWKQ